MDGRFESWLGKVVGNERTQSTKLSELRRIERTYGDLDALFDKDELESVLSELTYSAIDARNKEANPSKLEINGDIRNNLASYKSAVNKYVHFRRAVESEVAHGVVLEQPDEGDEHSSLTFGLERDLQAALRQNIGELEEGLSIIDGGNERRVASGRIDILAGDASGRTIVIELKAVPAPLKAMAQVASYMGDIHAEERLEQAPRGIIVAPSFDPKLVLAARVVPGLRLIRYSFRFAFAPIVVG